MRLADRDSTQWKCITCVSQRPAAFLYFPSGPKLICCGQIVCKGENVRCLCGCWAPLHQPPPFVSAPADSCSPHSWKREGPLAGNFTPAHSCFPTSFHASCCNLCLFTIFSFKCSTWSLWKCAHRACRFNLLWKIKVFGHAFSDLSAQWTHSSVIHLGVLNL